MGDRIDVLGVNWAEVFILNPAGEGEVTTEVRYSESPAPWHEASRASVTDYGCLSEGYLTFSGPGKMGLYVTPSPRARTLHLTAQVTGAGGVRYVAGEAHQPASRSILDLSHPEAWTSDDGWTGIETDRGWTFRALGPSGRLTSPAIDLGAGQAWLQFASHITGQRLEGNVEISRDRGQTWQWIIICQPWREEFWQPEGDFIDVHPGDRIRLGFRADPADPDATWQIASLLMLSPGA